MKVRRIFQDASLVPGQTLTLDSDRAHYVVRVLRLSAGDPLQIFDGKGGEAQARIVSIAGKSVDVAIDAMVKPCATESQLHIGLVQGISKGDRMDYSIQKATELGVAEIFPVFTRRSEVRLAGRRLENRREHWQQVAVSACEQCGRAVVPRVHEPQDLRAALASIRPGVLLDGSVDTRLADMDVADRLVLAVGPEGGFEAEEVAMARSAGWACVRLGPRTLRSETAGPAAIAAAQILWGDL